MPLWGGGGVQFCEIGVEFRRGWLAHHVLAPGKDCVVLPEMHEVHGCISSSSGGPARARLLIRDWRAAGIIMIQGQASDVCREWKAAVPPLSPGAFSASLPLRFFFSLPSFAPPCAMPDPALSGKPAEVVLPPAVGGAALCAVPLQRSFDDGTARPWGWHMASPPARLIVVHHVSRTLATRLQDAGRPASFVYVRRRDAILLGRRHAPTSRERLLAAPRPRTSSASSPFRAALHHSDEPSPQTTLWPLGDDARPRPGVGRRQHMRSRSTSMPCCRLGAQKAGKARGGVLRPSRPGRASRVGRRRNGHVRTESPAWPKQVRVAGGCRQGWPGEAVEGGDGDGSERLRGSGQEFASLDPPGGGRKGGSAAPSQGRVRLPGGLLQTASRERQREGATRCQQPPCVIGLPELLPNLGARGPAPVVSSPPRCGGRASTRIRRPCAPAVSGRRPPFRRARERVTEPESPGTRECRARRRAPNTDRHIATTAPLPRPSRGRQLTASKVLTHPSSRC